MYPNFPPNNSGPYPPYTGQQQPPIGFNPQCPYPQPQQGAGVQPYPPQGQYPSPYPQQTPYPPPQGQFPTYPPSPFGQPAAAVYQQPPQQGYYSPGPGQGAYPVQATAQLYHQGPQGGYPQQHSMAMAGQQQYQNVPTITPINADPQADAQVLRKAMKGFGTDEEAIIKVLSKRTDAQRQAIITAYKASFGKDLIKDLKSELGGKLEDVIMALMTPRHQYLAQQLNKAIAGLGTKESVLIDVLCASTNFEIRAIGAAYQQLFKAPLESHLKGDTSGHFERLLVSICQGARSEDVHVNPVLAADDAQKLLSAGEKKWGTDESMFNMILATRSFPQLRGMFQEYERLTGHAFERAIEREFSGDVKDGMMAIVRCARSTAAYFAKRLHDSLAGLGTKDNDLIFIIVSRAEIDLGSIANEYQTMYGKPLANDVSGDTSGDYKKVLLALLGR